MALTEEDFGKVQIILNNQQDLVIFQQVVSVIRKRGGKGNWWLQIILNGEFSTVYAVAVILCFGCVRVLGFNLFRHCIRQIDAEGGAGFRSTGQLQFTAKKGGKLFGDGKSKTGAAVLSGGASVFLSECLKYFLMLFLRYADAGVPDTYGQCFFRGKPNSSKICILVSRGDLNKNPSLLRKLQGVCHQVSDDLFQPRAVGNYGRRSLMRNCDGKIKTLLVKQVFEVSL